MELNTNPAPDLYVEAMREWKPIISNGVIPQPKGPPLNQWREVCRWDEPSIWENLSPLEYGPQPEPIDDETIAVAKDEALKMVLGERDFELLRQMAELWPTSMELWEAFSNMAAAFEELAGEHRLLQGCGDEIVEMLNKGQLVRAVIPDSPGPGWYWVRGHWRSRAQNSAAIDPDQGTVQAAPGEGQTGASGEATGHSPEGADPQIRDAYCRGRSGIPLGNWCNESQSGDATGADKEQPCPGCGSYRGTHGLGCRILALTQSGEERSE